MGSINGFIKNGLIATIKLYRFSMSCLLGHCCRFQPTCSLYAIEAIEQYGCVKGCLLSMRRLLSCHPWHPGGFDPVVKPRTKRGAGSV